MTSQAAVLGDALLYLIAVPRRGIQLNTLAPVAFDRAFNPKEEVGPNSLRACVAAPHSAEESVGQKEDQRGEDQETGEVVDLLRP